MSEGGKCFGVKTVTKRNRLCMGLAGDIQGRSCRQGNIKQRLKGGEGEGASPMGSLDSGPCSGKNKCKNLGLGVCLILSLASVYVASPYSSTCTQKSCYLQSSGFSGLHLHTM